MISHAATTEVQNKKRKAMTDNDKIILRVFSNEIEAEMARGHLESEGIQCFLLKNNLVGTWPESGAMPEARLIVFRIDQEKAGKILKAMGT